MILYGRDGPVYFSVLLKENVIFFKSGSVEVASSSNVVYSDDRWHNVMAVHETDHLYLIVDDFDEYK